MVVVAKLIAGIIGISVTAALGIWLWVTFWWLILGLIGVGCAGMMLNWAFGGKLWNDYY